MVWVKCRERKQGLIFQLILPLVWRTCELKMRSRFGIRSHLVYAENVCPWCLQYFFPMLQILLQGWLLQGTPPPLPYHSLPNVTRKRSTQCEYDLLGRVITFTMFSPNVKGKVGALGGIWGIERIKSVLWGTCNIIVLWSWQCAVHRPWGRRFVELASQCF